jgi:hypothetical protein
MRFRIRALIAPAAAGLILVATLATSIAGAQTAPPFGTNLVVNGGAEAEVGAPDSSKIVKPSGWTTTGEFTAVQYGASGGFPDAKSPGPAARGKNLFEGGNVAKSTATQSISLSAAVTEIASGSVHYAFSAWLGGYSNQGDNATASISFRDAAGKALGGAMLGPVTPADRKDVTGLLERTHSGAVPKGAATAIVTIVLTRLAGIYNDGSVDSVSLVLTKT